MNKDEIAKVIAILEREVPRDGARVRLCQYGGGPDEGQVVGNDAGFVRLGIEFLKGAIAAPKAGHASAVEVDLAYLITSDSDIRFDWFERREPSEPLPQTRSRLIPFLMFSGVLAVGLLAILGLVTIVRWLAA
jgi:hypothetical protein